MTSLASEFYVMSILNRLGFDAHLTLGNKKLVDIVVVRGPGDSVTIDVKAVAGATDWLAGSGNAKAKDNRGKTTFDYAQENWRLKGTDALKQLEEASK